MKQIMCLMCEQRELTLHEDIEQDLQPILARLREVEGIDFANGRSARNFLDAMQAHLDERLATDPTADPHQLTLDDVPMELRG